MSVPNFLPCFFAVGFLLCHQALAQEQPARLWAGALESGWVVGLFRDEVIHIHSYIQTFFDGIKGCSKKASEVKEFYNQAVQKAPYRHRERRKFLRTSLKELGLILTDQPGLLGPKVRYPCAHVSLQPYTVIF